MTYQIKERKLEELKDNVLNLENLLTEQIVDLHKVKGGVPLQHSFVFYRQLLWYIKDMLEDDFTKVIEPNAKK